MAGNDKAAPRQRFSSVWDAIERMPADAAIMRVRSELMIALTEHIKAKRWRKVEAAEHLGVPQPRISDLINGKISKFDVEDLVGLLAATGLDLRLRRYFESFRPFAG
ncbi:MAG: XRE family transcriptional regulator [Alphaproteobacteria bacterium]|nr:XRE family transcriptional regulator [Alphaproteobacteria bacterium]